MNVGAAIRELMNERGMRSIDLCRASGISAGYLSMVLNSKISDPSLLRVKMMANALGVTVDEIVELADKYEE